MDMNATRTAKRRKNDLVILGVRDWRMLVLCKECQGSQGRKKIERVGPARGRCANTDLCGN